MDLISSEMFNGIKRFYTPNRTSLLRHIKKHISDASILSIASADYGGETDLHLEKIQSILERCDVQGRLEWHPLEVLTLQRWSEYPSDDRRNVEFREQHLARSLACTILLLADEMPENSQSGIGDSDTIIQWVDSIVKLGGKIISPSMEFLLWKLEVNRDPEVRRFLLFGLLILLVEFGNLAMIDRTRFIELIENEDRAARSAVDQSVQSKQFLFVTSFRGQLFAKWIEYAERARDAMADPWFSMLVDTMKQAD